MAEEKKREEREPKGFTPDTEGPAGKAATEEGWDLNDEERKKPKETPEIEGGTDYDYGPQDFGDTPERTGDLLDPKEKAS